LLKSLTYTLSSSIRLWWILSCAIFSLGIAVPGLAQQTQGQSFFTPADSFDNRRFWIATGITTVAYTATVIGLNEIWYKQYPRSEFHFQNDWGEWHNVDKMGHLFTSYLYSSWVSDIARWTGIESKKADWIGVGTSLLFQTTIEVMDGFSDRWGFSWSDMAFNVAGAGLYIGQQRLWNEQRILLKFSSTPVSHPDYIVTSEDGQSVMTLNQRADDLFGTGYFERLLKDYNAQTIWASVNIYSFLREESRFPKWLNVAFGYGAYNMYGGYENKWEKDGAHYTLDGETFPRYSQYYLSVDVDLSKIRTKSPFLRTLLGILNVIKIPAPAIQFNKVDGVRFHAIKF
jgi:uncharacterized protein YfiM (DUF2279 family)